MIQNTRIALAPYQAEYQFLTSNDAFTVFGMIHRDQIHFRFFYKKLLVGRDGIYSLFESYSENPKPFWWSPFGFLLWRKVSFESFTFDLRFFPIHRSEKYRTNCSSDPFLNPAFQLGLWHSRNHLAVKKWFRGFSGRSHPARSGRVLQLPWWSCSPFFPRCGSSCYP